ncbi:hypothetical protein [Streptomyces sp. NPDC097619]|uniref:hypothetical protein n=1 Tax=Streptomyces sp. NPDC097619 TaxID=3157228 RepID=UPI003333D033
MAVGQRAGGPPDTAGSALPPPPAPTSAALAPTPTPPPPAPDRQEYEQVLDTVVTAVSEAYYAEVVQEVRVARGRAQAAQSTVTLAGGGLMAALSVTALADRPPFMQWLGIGSVLLWLAAAVLYIRAIASPLAEEVGRAGDEDDPLPEKAATREELLNGVLGKVRHGARDIDGRQRLGNRVACLAVVASLVTFALAVTTEPVRETAEGTLLVDASYTPTLRVLCPGPGSGAGRIDGKIVKSSLTGPYVEIEPAPGACGPAGRAAADGARLFVPRAKVIGVRWQDA